MCCLLTHDPLKKRGVNSPESTCKIDIYFIKVFFKYLFSLYFVIAIIIIIIKVLIIWEKLINLITMIEIKKYQEIKKIIKS